MLFTGHPTQFIPANLLTLSLIVGLLTIPSTLALAENIAGAKAATASITLDPRVNYSGYQALHIEAASVEFKDNWLRNYNRGKRSRSNRLDARDIEAIKKRFAENFNKTFRRYLAENASYSINSLTADDPTVRALVIKPSIIELNINGPAKATADHNYAMVYRAGSATLALEIYDAKSGQLLGKIIDTRKTHEYSHLIRTNRVVNNFEFQGVYKKWAKNFLTVLQ